MVEASKSGQMGRNIKDFGKMIRPKEEADLSTVMEMYIKVNGKMIKLMEKEYIFIFQAQLMKAIG